MVLGDEVQGCCISECWSCWIMATNLMRQELDLIKISAATCASFGAGLFIVLRNDRS